MYRRVIHYDGSLRLKRVHIVNCDQDPPRLLQIAEVPEGLGLVGVPVRCLHVGWHRLLLLPDREGEADLFLLVVRRGSAVVPSQKAAQVLVILWVGPR